MPKIQNLDDAAAVITDAQQNKHRLEVRGLGTKAAEHDGDDCAGRAGRIRQGPSRRSRPRPPLHGAIRRFRRLQLRVQHRLRRFVSSQRLCCGGAPLRPWCESGKDACLSLLAPRECEDAPRRGAPG